MSKISKNIRQLRSENKMTQDTLAEKINVTRQTVSSWETDRTQPDIDMLETLSGVFGVSIEELIYGKKNRVGLEPENKPDRKIYTIVLSIFGTVLTVAGLIILFIEFWDDLSFAKNIFAMLPLFAGFALAFFALTKKKESVAWREGSAVAWTAGIAITNALINSLNAADVGFFPLLLLDAVLILPVLFLTKGIFPFAAYFYAICHLLIGLNRYNTPLGIILHAVLLFVMFGVGVYFFKKHKANDAADAIRFWILFAAFGFYLIMTPVCLLSCLYYEMIVALLFVFFTAVYAAGDRFSPRPVRQVGAFGAVAMSYFILFCNSGYPGVTGSFFIISCSALLLPAAGAVLNRKNLFCDKIKLSVLGMSFIEFAVFLLTVNSQNDDVIFFRVLPVFIISAAIIVRGVNDAKLSVANFGMLNAAALIIILFFVSDLDILIKGFAVLAAGIILLIINKLLIKKFSKETEVKTDA